MLTDADRLAGEVVAAGEARLRGRIVAWYVTGSYADGSAVPGSDLDIVAVLDGDALAEEDQALRQARHGLGEPYRIFVDISVVGTNSLFSNGSVAIGLRSRCIEGRDIRARIPAIDMARYRRQAMHTPFAFSARIREASELHCPLAAPDPAMPFLGYEVCRFLPDGHHDRNSLKDMVAIGSYMATALVAQKSDRPLTSKAEALARYRALGLGPWTELLTALVDVVRGRWHWKIPEGSADREYLRLQCDRLLSFENEFYHAYAEFLRQQRESPPDGADALLLKRLATFRHAALHEEAP